MVDVGHNTRCSERGTPYSLRFVSRFNASFASSTTIIRESSVVRLSTSPRKPIFVVWNAWAPDVSYDKRPRDFSFVDVQPQFVKRDREINVSIDPWIHSFPELDHQSRYTGFLACKWRVVTNQATRYPDFIPRNTRYALRRLIKNLRRKKLRRKLLWIPI